MSGSNNALQRPTCFDGLRELYRPLQPTITDNDKGITYKEYLPHPSLHSFIYCYWELRTNRLLDHPFTYRVVADGCIDIFFSMTNLAESSVMGFSKSFTEFPIGISFHYAGIRFLPTMFPQLFGIDASLLTNKSLDLVQIVPKVATFIKESLKDGRTQGDVNAMLDRYLLEQVAVAPIDADARFYDAIRQILTRRGMVTIENELDTGLSSRQLRRLFDYYVGVSMKSFSKVIRFQNFLNTKPSSGRLTQSKLFIDAGYYDQAHFIKEFRNFYGVTPSKALGR